MVKYTSPKIYHLHHFKWFKHMLLCFHFRTFHFGKTETLSPLNTSASLTMLKPLIVWITTNCEKFLKRWEHQTTLPAFGETYMQVKKQ